MSGTGTSTGDFDDDQRGFVTEPDEQVSADAIFTEVASGTAVAGSTDDVESEPPAND